MLDDGMIYYYYSDIMLHDIPCLSDSIEQLEKLSILKHLYLCSKSTISLHDSIGRLESRTQLNLCHSAIIPLPPSIGRLQNLGYRGVEEAGR